jgi:hypothetical protein
MNYYITDYDFEKHPLLVEPGGRSLRTTTQAEWLDMPQLFFLKNNVVKVAYSISVTDQDTVFLTFFNDLTLKAKDKHRLSVEEITIFMLLLMSETLLESTSYLRDNFKAVLTEGNNKSPEAIMNFVIEQMHALN